MKFIKNKTIILSIIVLISFIINNTNGQYASDPCSSIHTEPSGFISTNRSIPQTCWKIIPTTGTAYLIDDITVTFINATIPVNNTIKFIGGSNILTDSPIVTFENGTYNQMFNQTSTNKGVFVIFLDGDNANDIASFTVYYTSSSEKHLKPSVVGLLSVAVAFAVPLVVFTLTRCLIPNSASKERAISIKKAIFWCSFILGLVFLAMILSRKVV
ncbi:hypothetical protein RB653_004511 [Dictyostelium firmibasis]|uniref:Uncharacterized protein n=1 Tax=Dictyostelium firmibasis TaxID=79012 RepID=A0AAN7Z067_9MYCE